MQCGGESVQGLCVSEFPSGAVASVILFAHSLLPWMGSFCTSLFFFFLVFTVQSTHRFPFHIQGNDFMLTLTLL